MSVPKQGRWENGKWGAPTGPRVLSGIISVETRVALLILLLVVEAIIVKFILHPQAEGYDGRYAVLGRAVFPIALYFIIAMSLMNFARMRTLWRALIDANRSHHWRIAVILQLSCFGIFLFSAAHLMPSGFGTAPTADSNSELRWDILLAICTISTAVLSFRIIAPYSFWREFFGNEKTAMLIALAFSCLSYGFGVFMQQSWDVLGQPTMRVSTILLKLVYRDDVLVDLNAQLLGTSRFTVAIGYRCSGYEGIGMIVAFITWYLWNYSRYFRFPAILLLYPLGITLMWLFNTMRIAALIAIGSSVSPQLAKTGFHSNAGLISFVIVSFGIIWLTRRSRVFERGDRGLEIRVDSGNVMLIPFLVMLATTLFSSAFSTEFQWLYPLRAIATGLAILFLWKSFSLTPSFPRIFPVFCGIAAFLVWIALVAPSVVNDRSFAQALFAAPEKIAIAWMAFRFLGSVIIVPIAEELAFRGYLFHLLGIEAGKNAGQVATRWLAIAAIALSFGMLHGNWIAASIAGMLYGIVRLRSGRIWDAIIAHMTTNLLLALHVLHSGHWSYWQ